MRSLEKTQYISYFFVFYWFYLLIFKGQAKRYYYITSTSLYKKKVTHKEREKGKKGSVGDREAYYTINISLYTPSQKKTSLAEAR